MTMPTTPSQTIGPFFAIMMPLGSNALVDRSAEDAIEILGQIFDDREHPVPDALVEIWQADADGIYAHPADDRFTRSTGFTGFGRCSTDADGRYSFLTMKPGAVRGFDERMQAPHISLAILARGLLKRVTTRVYFPDEEHANANDPAMLAVDQDRRATLVARPAGPARLRFDVRLRGTAETVFFDV